MAVFIAGEIIFGHFAARNVVVSMSSASPFAILAITFAVAGATIKRSADCAMETCVALNSKFLSKVSTRHLFPVRVSNAIGLMILHAFAVIRTCTLASFFTSMLTREAALYAAMLPETPTSIFLFFSTFIFLA